jgi:opacity protein-like surface antigen
MRDSKKNVLFSLLLLFTHMAHALEKDNADDTSKSLIVTLSAGPVFGKGGQTQTFYLQPFIENTYAANHRAQTIFDGEIFVAGQHHLYKNFQGQLGVAVAGLSKVSIGGQIWNDADPVFNNFNYAYTLQNTRLAVKGKLLADYNFLKTQPYLSLGLGLSFNHAYNYRSIPLLYEVLPTPNFSPHTSVSFAYAVGAGIQHQLNKNLFMGIGYEFADWGYSRLGLAPTQTLGHGLIMNNFYTNGLLFNLTYAV